MKRLILLWLIAFTFPILLFAQGDPEENVLSYYAAGNTLDGQPLIDKNNVLRFYPVFALRQKTHEVIMTLYIGPNVFTVKALDRDDKRYWQINLPKFKLGEAIQRLDVETVIEVDDLRESNKKKIEITNLRLLSELRISSNDNIDSSDRIKLSIDTSKPEGISILRDSITADIIRMYTDTNYVGQSVRPSDITVSKNNDTAHILYRNYNQNLRRLVALDPAERLGLFRARFVPFAVVDGRLRRAFSGVENTIFEVGLSFGDPIVRGDEFVVPEFSIQRMGFAFAITPRLFADSAEIMALVITYDFNSYGSIGIGANFRFNEPAKLYWSFGINKRAFENVLKEVQKLFN